MKIAFINPIHHLELTHKSGYYLLLTHLAQGYSEYVNFWNREPGYKILDNSLIELGYALPIGEVLAVAETLKVDEIVLPDVYLDFDETVRAVSNSLSQIIMNKKYPFPYKLQAVAQGSTSFEWQKCWDLFSRNNDIDVIAIPKVTETLFPNGRPEAVRYALANNPNGKEIHLLGCWSDIGDELSTYSRQELNAIRGMDTSLVYHCTVEGQNFLMDETQKPNYKIDLEAEYEIDRELLYKNQRYTELIAS